MRKKKPVPPYIWNGNSWDRQQSGFFRRWKNAWYRGDTLDIEGQLDYIKRYIYLSITEPPYESILDDLLRIRNTYGDVVEYLLFRITACYILLGRYGDALEVLKSGIQVGARQESLVSEVLSLKLIMGQRIEGQDILSLYGPQVTSIGMKHLDKIVECLDVMVKIYERENDVNLIEAWASVAHTYPYRVSAGMETAIETDLTSYSFRDCRKAQALAIP